MDKNLEKPQDKTYAQNNAKQISFLEYQLISFATELTLVLIFYLFRLDFANWLSRPNLIISVVIVGLAALSIASWVVALNYRKIETRIELLSVNPKEERRFRTVLFIVFLFSLILTIIFFLSRANLLQIAQLSRLTWNNAFLALLIIFLINSVVLLWKSSKNIINLTKPFSRHKAELWSVAVLQFLLIFVFFSPILEQNKIPVNSDYILNFYPWKSVQSKEGSIINPVLSDSIDGVIQLHNYFYASVAKGEFPLWNPYVNGGTPHALLLFSGTFNLENLGFALGGSGWGPVIYFYIKLFLAGFFFYLFLRNLEVSLPASLLGMITYSFSSYIIVNLATDVADSLVFAPIILVEGEHWLAGKKFKHLVWISVVTALTILSGFPAITIYVLLFTVEYFVFRVLVTGQKDETWKEKISKLATLAGGYLAGIGLAAVSLLPTIEFFMNINLSYRVGRGATVLRPDFIFRLFTNNICGNPVEGGFYCGSNYNETALYTSLIAVLLIPLAFRKNRNRNLSILLFCNALIVLATVFGFMKVNLLVSKIPLLNISVNTRMIAMLPILLCTLGAIGFDGMKKNNTGKLIILLETIFILSIVYFILHTPDNYPLISRGGTSYEKHSLYSAVICLVFLGTFLATQVLKNRNTRLLLGILVITFSFYDIGQVLLTYNGASDPRNINLMPPGLSYLKENQTNYERMIPMSNNTLVPSLGMSYGLNAVLGHWFTSPEYRSLISLIDPKIYSATVVTQPIFTSTMDSQSPFIDLLRVKHFIVSPSTPATFELKVAALQYEYNNSFDINQYDKFSQTMVSIREQSVSEIYLRVDKSKFAETIPVIIKVLVNDELSSQASTVLEPSVFEGWLKASFPPARVNQGQTVNIEIDPPNQDSIGRVYLANFDVYRQGVFKADGNLVNNDIAFILATKDEGTENTLEMVYDGDIKIYENKDLPQNLPIIRDVIQANNKDQCLSILPGIDPFKTAIVENVDRLPLSNLQADNHIETAQISGYSANTVQITTNLRAPALIVLSDTYFPGWEVKINGMPSQIINTNCMMRGVFVDAGNSLIEMEYRPISGLAGGIISGISCLILVLIAIIRKNMRVNSKNQISDGIK